MYFYDRVSFRGIAEAADGRGVVIRAQVETSMQQNRKIFVLV